MSKKNLKPSEKKECALAAPSGFRYDDSAKVCISTVNFADIVSRVHSGYWRPNDMKKPIKS